MKQTGLIQRVIEAVGLKDGMLKVKFTPSEQRPLVKDADDKPPSGMFIYGSIFGMILYLSVHNRPDIYFAVNFCARYMFIPQRYRELELKRLAQYLENTQDHGLVLDKNYDILKVDVCPDAEFAGMYWLKKHDDPACANSHTGFIIKSADCPVLCISKLQTETSLSTMESEIIALAHCCQEMFPIIDITQSLGKSVWSSSPVPIDEIVCSRE